MRRIVHATNCPCDELSMQRIIRDELSATSCPCDELSSHRSGDLKKGNLFSQTPIAKFSSEKLII